MMCVVSWSQPITVKRFMSNHSSSHMQARTAPRQLITLHHPLVSPSLVLFRYKLREAQELKKENRNVHATFDKFLTTLQAQLECFASPLPNLDRTDSRTLLGTAPEIAPAPQPAHSSRTRPPTRPRLWNITTNRRRRSSRRLGQCLALVSMSRHLYWARLALVKASNGAQSWDGWIRNRASSS